jgi:hypothetical protein
MWRPYRDQLPVFRVTAEDYDGVEYREAMTAGGMVYTLETGYLNVHGGQKVWVYLNTLTHGHGGNRFDEYVWVASCPDAWAEYGWLPNNLVLFAERLALATPLATEATMPHTQAHPSATEATPPVTEATGHEQRFSEIFEC